MGSTRLCPLGMGGLADPKKHVPRQYVLPAKGGRSALKVVSIENSQKWGVLGH